MPGEGEQISSEEAASGGRIDETIESKVKKNESIEKLLQEAVLFCLELFGFPMYRVHV